MSRTAEMSLPDIAGTERRQRGLQLRTNLLPERRKLVAVLVRDAEASNSLCEIFRDVESAEAFIRARLERQERQGFFAFWTLGEELDVAGTNGEQDRELMVVVRDSERPDFVQPLTFRDVQSAQRFLRSDSDPGFSLSDVSICWALPINITTDRSGVIKLSPSLPPRADRQGLAGALTLPASPTAVKEVQTPTTDLHWEVTARDKVSEVRRVLAVKRWQIPPAESFSGFRSPRGRF
jgi:hypothetical protein